MVSEPTVDWLMNPPRSRGIVLGAEVMAAVSDVLLIAIVVAVAVGLVVETLLFVSSEVQREREREILEKQTKLRRV